MKILRVILAAAAALVLDAALAPGSATAGGDLFLSWHAAHGSDRARDSLSSACNDTARVDTLYLSFELDLVRPELTSMEGTLYFTPLGGDTLGDFWRFKSGWANGGNLWVEFAPFTDVPSLPPWGPEAQTLKSEVSYDMIGGRGRLKLNANVPEANVEWLRPGAVYTFARVLIYHRRAGLSGCTQPVCIEWGRALMRFATGREVEIARGERFVTWRAAPGACGSEPRDLRTKPWRPR